MLLLQQQLVWKLWDFYFLIPWILLISSTVAAYPLCFWMGAMQHLGLAGLKRESRVTESWSHLPPTTSAGREWSCIFLQNKKDTEEEEERLLQEHVCPARRQLCFPPNCTIGESGSGHCWHWARNERGSPQFLTHLQPCFALSTCFALLFSHLHCPIFSHLLCPVFFNLLCHVFSHLHCPLFALKLPCLFALSFHRTPKCWCAAVRYREHLIGWTKYRFDQRRGELRHLRESRINIAGSCQTKPSKAAGIWEVQNMSLLQKYFWILTDDFNWISPTGVVFRDSFTGCPRYNSTCEAQWPSAQNDSLYRESRLTQSRRDGR